MVRVMQSLGKMYIVLSDETERRLRLAVVTVFGGKKGDLSTAIEAAIKEWLGKHATEADITKWVRSQLHEREPAKRSASR
jgi:hypothetical protein